MEWLNYHHLLYFWVVAKEGSVVSASRKLRLAHPTISAQIHRLEDALGERLLERQGRSLELTEVGHAVFRYADEIFTLGRELQDMVKGRPTGRPIRLLVGLSDSLSKSIALRILEPAFQLEEDLRVICREDRSVEEFVGELATHTIDVVLSDTPAGAGTPVRAYSHVLGECGTVFFAAPPIAKSCRRGFPRSLDGAPLILPGAKSMLRRTLDAWLDSRDIRPKVVAEADDAALAKTLGEAGLGVFVEPDVVEREVRQRFRVELVGRAEDLRQRFYAISVERKIRHPAVVAICERARKDIFA